MLVIRHLIAKPYIFPFFTHPYAKFNMVGAPEQFLFYCETSCMRLCMCACACVPVSQALEDAGWATEACSMEARDRTGVTVGAGMSCTEDMANAGTLLVRVRAHL